MLEYSFPAVLVKCNKKNTKKQQQQQHEPCRALSNIENDHKKKYSQSNLQQKETVEEVISLSNMRGQPFKCVVGTPIRFPRVP